MLRDCALILGLFLSSLCFAQDKAPALDPQLEPVSRIGYRAVQWLEALRSGPRADLAREIQEEDKPLKPWKTYDNPNYSSARNLRNWFDNLYSRMDPRFKAMLESGNPLPNDLGSDVPDEQMRALAQELIGIGRAYSNIPWWQNRYAQRNDPKFSKEQVDVAPILRLIDDADALTKAANAWKKLSSEARARWMDLVLGACFRLGVLGGDGDSACEEARKAFASDEAGFPAVDWLGSALVESRKTIDAKLRILHPAPGLKARHEGMKTILEVPVFGADPAFLEQAARILESRWGFDGKLGFELVSQPGDAADFLHFLFQPNAYLHYVAEGPRTIYFDSAGLQAPTWILQQLFSHEFGHYLGFPDCYVEYWDEALQSFVDYPIDAGNIMCDMIGSAHPVHWKWLKKEYFSGFPRK